MTKSLIVTTGWVTHGYLCKGPNMWKGQAPSKCWLVYSIFTVGRSKRIIGPIGNIYLIVFASVFCWASSTFYMCANGIPSDNCALYSSQVWPCEFLWVFLDELWCRSRLCPFISKKTVCGLLSWSVVLIIRTASSFQGPCNPFFVGLLLWFLQDPISPLFCTGCLYWKRLHLVHSS
jgi:hypothetical protein